MAHLRTTCPHIGRAVRALEGPAAECLVPLADQQAGVTREIGNALRLAMRFDVVRCSAEDAPTRRQLVRHQVRLIDMAYPDVEIEVLVDQIHGAVKYLPMDLSLHLIERAVSDTLRVLR